MTRPLFSIITVVRNDIVGVTKTMQSIFSQTLPNYEVIVQDGASTDGTTEVLRGFGDWIDSLVVEKDDGIYDAMNRALARCTGDWVQFLNAADFFVDEKVLETVAAHLKPDDDIFIGVPIRDEDGKPHQYRPRDKFWAGSVNDHQATFVRREIAQNLRFDPSYPVAGDLDFFLRARDLGAREHVESIPIVRKPFGVGASSAWHTRFSERERLLVAMFEGQYPVRAMMDKELRNYVAATYDVAPDVMDRWTYVQLKSAVQHWEDVLSVERNKWYG